MKFSYDGKEYELHFTYNDRTTVCQLVCGDNEICAATSTRKSDEFDKDGVLISPADQPFKEIGRQWALWRVASKLQIKGLRELRGQMLHAFFSAARTNSKKLVRHKVSVYIRGAMPVKRSVSNIGQSK